MDSQQGYFNEYMDLASGTVSGDSYGQANGADVGAYHAGYSAYDDPPGYASAYGASQAAWPQQGAAAGGSSNKPQYYSSYGSGFDQDELDEYGDDLDDLATSSATPEARSSSKNSSSGSSSTGKKSSTSSKSSVDSSGSSSKKSKQKAKSAKELAAEEELKRNKFLERNRMAASKCRQKKKEYVSDLEDQKEGLEVYHANLQREYQGLLGEVSLMKNQLMQHATCNDPKIDQWIDNEARKFVHGGGSGGGQYKQQAYCLGHDHGQPGHDCSAYDSQ